MKEKAKTTNLKILAQDRDSIKLTNFMFSKDNVAAVLKAIFPQSETFKYLNVFQLSNFKFTLAPEIYLSDNKI